MNREDIATASEDAIASLFSDPVDHQQELVQRAKAYLSARQAKEEAEEFVKRLTSQAVMAETELLRSMDAAGVRSLKIDHDGRTCGITQTQTTHYSMPSGSLEQPDFYSWFVEAGGGDLVKSSVHHASFSSFCKELKENTLNGVALHPSIKIAERRGIQLRKG